MKAQTLSLSRVAIIAIHARTIVIRINLGWIRFYKGIHPIKNCNYETIPI